MDFSSSDESELTDKDNASSSHNSHNWDGFYKTVSAKNFSDKF
jgi:hypothetical protein